METWGITGRYGCSINLQHNIDLKFFQLRGVKKTEKTYGPDILERKGVCRQDQVQKSQTANWPYFHLMSFYSNYTRPRK